MKKRDDGFTIPELLVVMVIVGVLVIGIAAVFMSAQQTQARALLLDTATRAGQLQIESLRNYNYTNLVPGEDIVFTDELPDTLPNDRSGVVRVTEPEPGLKRIDVEITYTTQGRQERVALSSMIGILGIAQ
jgi:prepilin-type N-terminal cleavage/methylation domain-containing protein